MKYLNPRYWAEALTMYLASSAALFHGVKPTQDYGSTELMYRSSTNSGLLSQHDFNAFYPPDNHKRSNYHHKARRAKHRRRNTQGSVTHNAEQVIAQDFVRNVMPAARIGDWEVVKRFTEDIIKEDTNITNSYRNKIGAFVLFEAVKQGNLKLVKFFINNGININLYGLCTLDSEHLDIPNLFPECGSSPLFMAIKQCNLKMVKLLANNGANVNAVSNKGRSVLLYAKEECSNPEIISSLIDKGAVDTPELERDQLVDRVVDDTPQVKLTTISIADTNSIGRA